MMGVQCLGVSLVSSPYLGVIRSWAFVFGLLSEEGRVAEPKTDTSPENYL